MNKLFSTLLLSVTLATFGGAAAAHMEHGQPQFGGVVAEGGIAQFEVVSKDGKVTVYVTSHGAPVSTAGASGKLTALVGTAKSEIELKPLGENQMAGAGDIPSGAKMLVSIQLSGQKPLQARAVAK